MNIIKINKETINSVDISGLVKPVVQSSVEPIVSEVIQSVKNNGLSALIKYSKKFDQYDLIEDELFLNPKNFFSLDTLDSKFISAIDRAILNVKKFHSKQKPFGYEYQDEHFSFYGESWVPLDRVGCYIPGGSAPLVSTLLMTVIPASIAGVKEIIVVTPPCRDYKLNPYIAYVCDQLNVDSVLCLGGAQAIAALAYGFQEFKPVDKVVGPGNAFVTEAKKQIFGQTDIDMLAGPSEVCVLADETANPSFIAADILSQLEHDPNSKASLIFVGDGTLPLLVNQQIFKQKEKLERLNIVEKSIENLSFFQVDNIKCGYDLINKLAPEHLEIMVDSPDLEVIRFLKAGAIFIGDYTPVAVGDFYGGTNHVLPTDLRARFSSPLSVYDFYRRVNFMSYTPEKMKAVANDIEVLANAEQLDAHENSVAVRRLQLINQKFNKGSKTDET